MISIQGIIQSLFRPRGKNISPINELDLLEKGMIKKRNKNTDIRVSVLGYPDLELGFGPTVKFDCDTSPTLNFDCGEVAIDIQGFENCKILENYFSFMESINYLSRPLKERNLSLNEEGNLDKVELILVIENDNTIINMIDENSIDIYSKLSKNNVM